MEKKIGARNWLLVWLLGMAGQICWNVENSWFNTFVYNKIAPDPAIVSWMVGASAVVTTFATFLVGTWSDRIGKRKPFICIGYMLWGLFTVVFGLGEFIPKTPIFAAAAFVVITDAVMSFFGSVGNDASFNAWTTDISDTSNRGSIAGALAVMPVLAAIFGSVVSAIIIDTFDYFVFFVIMGSMVTLIGAAGLIFMKDAPALKPTRDPDGFFAQVKKVFNWNTVKSNRELFWVFIIMLVYFIGFDMYFPYITIYFVNYLGIDVTMAGIIQGVGLGAAALLTFPASKLIDKGKVTLVLCTAVALNAVGLIGVAAANSVALLFVGVFVVGAGYILTLQTLTAWIKNLYPESARGQFEGIKQIFFVAIPMVIGPIIATPVINNLGVEMVVEGTPGMVPTPWLFIIAGALTLLAFAPIAVAGKLLKSRTQKI